MFMEMFFYATAFMLLVLFGPAAYRWIVAYNDRQAEKLASHFRSVDGPSDKLRIRKMLYWIEGGSFVVATIIGLNPFFGLWGLGFSLFAIGYTARLLDMREREKFDDQMIDVTFAFRNSLKSGMTLQQAMQLIATDFAAPASEQFKIAVREIQLGASVEEALHHLEERTPNAELKMMVNAIEILRQTGGNMVETFESLADTLKNRKRVEGRIKSLTAQGRIQAIMLCAMPFVMITILYFLSREYVMPLFNHPLGWIIMTVVVLLVSTGWVLIKKLITIEV